jgi:H+/Cl- antiporter ClcA
MKFRFHGRETIIHSAVVIGGVAGYFVGRAIEKWRLHLTVVEVSPNDLLKIMLGGIAGAVVGSFFCVTVAALIIWKKGR